MQGVLAIDLGSSSARLMLEEGGTITELSRFPVSAVQTEKGLRWDVPTLFEKLKSALDKVIALRQIAAIGIDSWGVDYGLIKQDGTLFDLPYCYRDSRCEEAFAEVGKLLSAREMFNESGIYPHAMNTVYQLYSDKLIGRYEGEKLTAVMMADLLAYYLTGKLYVEQTNASTTGLLSSDGTRWNVALMRRLGLDESLFAPLIFPGETYGSYHGVPVIAVCSHDTASAIHALGRLDSQSAYVASGSWLLLGALTSLPVISDDAFCGVYTNERGFDNAVTFLRNINGLFIIQRLVSEYGVTYKQVDEKIPLAKSIGIVDCSLLMSPFNMAEAVRTQLKVDTLQPFDAIKSVYDSLAVSLSTAITQLEKAIGRTIRRLYITGGATKAPYLLSRIRALCNAEVITGEGEGAVIGCVKVLREAINNT